MDRKVLIIDDEFFVRSLLEEDLKEGGYQVQSAENGKQGLEKIKSFSPMVVILDLKMPHMDGIEFLESLMDAQNREFLNGELLIIVLTGHGTDEDVKKCYSLGIHFFLRKPINLIELNGLTNRCFQLLEHKNKIHKLVAEEKQTNILLKSMFEGLGEGVVALDKEYKIRFVSHQVLDSMRISESMAINKSAFSVLGEELCGPNGLLINLRGKTPSQEKVECYLISPLGFKIPVLMTIKSMDLDDSNLSWLLIFKDLRKTERERIATTGFLKYGSMISCDQKMAEIFTLIDKVAPTSTNILIQGASGTGKELIAKEVHQRSLRANRIFHALNCAAVQPNLMESEFFGHEKGAFTGADRLKKGRFEMADRGTLFLDEVAEIPLEFQAKLLRVLQERSFERVGGSQSIHVDVRILAATNRDLEEMVEQGTFRSDLYYRLNVLKILLPSLEKRFQDVPILAKTFLDQLNQRDNKEIIGFTKPAIQLLMSYQWPGNVRELHNAIEHAFVICNQPEIRPEHLPEKIRQTLPVSKPESIPDNEHASLMDAYQKSGFDKKKTAALLGISLATLYRKFNKFDIS